MRLLITCSDNAYEYSVMLASSRKALLMNQFLGNCDLLDLYYAGVLSSDQNECVELA